MLKKTQDKNRNFVGTRWILDTPRYPLFFRGDASTVKNRFFLVFLVFAKNDKKGGFIHFRPLLDQK